MPKKTSSENNKDVLKDTVDFPSMEDIEKILKETNRRLAVATTKTKPHQK